MWHYLLVHLIMQKRGMKIAIITRLLFCFTLSAIGEEGSKNTFYSSTGKRLGYSQQAQGKKFYYDSGGKLLGYSKASSGGFRYYNLNGKYLGSSQKEDSIFFFVKNSGTE